MTPIEFLKKAHTVPYLRDGRDYIGWDCFGFVEMWHRELLGIEILDRKTHQSSPEGLAAGYRARENWMLLDGPRDHSVVIMKAAVGKKILHHGHCGMIYNNMVYHVEEKHGFFAQSCNDPAFTRRVTEYRKHEKCTSAPVLGSSGESM